MHTCWRLICELYRSRLSCGLFAPYVVLVEIGFLRARRGDAEVCSADRVKNRINYRRVNYCVMAVG